MSAPPDMTGSRCPRCHAPGVCSCYVVSKPAGPRLVDEWRHAERRRKQWARMVKRKASPQPGARAMATWVRPGATCINCGRPGPHFAPPSFGEPGFFVCNGGVT